MSGGVYNYAYHKVQEFADDLRYTELNPIRQTFKEHLYKVAKAMHYIEWVDSGDMEEGDEDPVIKECISKNEIMKTSIEMTERVVEILTDTIADLKKE